MRSRFSAFALGLGEYLVETLADDHPDRELGASLARELSRVKERQRFLGLCIVHAALLGDGESEDAEVLFHARVFERGVDRSFAELSTFSRAGGAWRYASGVMVPGSRIPDPAALTRDAFLAIAGEG
jgi:SEC-C motif-containing protein